MTCKDCIHYCVCKDLAETLEMEGCICNNFYHFKDKLRIVELPCKVGDTVYYFFSDSNYKKYEVCEIVGFHIDKYRTAFQIELYGYKCLVDTEFLGEKIFLTREEAEKKLKELNEKCL